MKIGGGDFVSRILVIMLIFCSLALGQNGKILVLDEPGKAVVRIVAICEYKLVLKEPKNKEVKIGISQLGDGFFVGDHSDIYDYIVTVDHIFKCDFTINSLERNGLLQELDRDRSEDLSPGNIMALKDGNVVNILVYTHDGISVDNIYTLFNSSFSKDSSDRVLLRGTLEKGVSHNHFPLMEDKVFDEIFYKNGIAKKIEVRGFLFMKNVWQFRYKDAEIEGVWEEFFKINELLDQGLSGSPTTYFHEGKLYAIGAVANAPSQESGRVFDMSNITIVKKSFLQKRNKK